MDSYSADSKTVLPLHAVPVIDLLARHDAGDRVDAVPAAALLRVVLLLLFLALFGKRNHFHGLLHLPDAGYVVGDRDLVGLEVHFDSALGGHGGVQHVYALLQYFIRM